MLQPATSPSGGNAGSYLVTSGNGTLNIQGVGPGTKDSVLYPIGTSASWLPMRIRNTGQADELRLRVLPDNLSQGFTGSPEDSVVTATWVLTEATAGGSTLTITPQWNESDEKPTFDRSRSIVQYYQAGWKFFGPRILTQASGNNPYFVTNSSLTGVSFNQTPLRVYG